MNPSQSNGTPDDRELEDPRICTGAVIATIISANSSEDGLQPLACGCSKSKISRRLNVLMVAASRARIDGNLTSRRCGGKARSQYVVLGSAPPLAWGWRNCGDAPQPSGISPPSHSFTRTRMNSTRRQRGHCILQSHVIRPLERDWGNAYAMLSSFSILLEWRFVAVEGF